MHRSRVVTGWILGAAALAVVGCGDESATTAPGGAGGSASTGGTSGGGASGGRDGQGQLPDGSSPSGADAARPNDAPAASCPAARPPRRFVTERLVPLEGETGSAPALAIGSDGEPRLAYRMNDEVWFTRRRERDTVYLNFRISRMLNRTVPSLGIGIHAGQTNVAFVETSAVWASTRLRSFSGDEPTPGDIELVKEIPRGGELFQHIFRLTFALGPDGARHALVRTGTETLEHAVARDATVTRSTLKSALGAFVQDYGMTVGPDGRPHVVMTDGDHLHTFERDGANWSRPRRVTRFARYFSPVILAARSGAIHVLGLADTIGLMHARGADEPGREQVADARPEVRRYVGQVPLEGNWLSAAVSDTGEIHAAYYVLGTEDLAYAHFDGCRWTAQIIAAEGRVGRYPSLALDARGEPHIAYQDDARKEIRYARTE